MILSRKFIKDYIDIDDKLTITEIAEDMTRVGNEYDYAGPLVNCTNLVVGKIIKCIDHPDSDHLHVCDVDIGKETLQIVCGAPNAREGITVIVALPGAKLPGGEIKKGKIRGVESNGMMCSKEELGLDNKFLTDADKEGIHEFDSDVKLGMNAIEALNLDDEIIDFELTSNRGDELSVLGLAYELGAIYDKKVKDIDLSYKEEKDSINGKFNVEVKTDNCNLFLAKKALNVTIKESPDFIKNRLIACGIRPINNVVDISNYVMLETGQPLHYYDADSLGDTLVVRMAKEDEKLTTLDGEERILSSNDIVIANKKDAVGLAGVMGGLNTEVESTTKNIIIESAIFDAACIRKTSKKILRSEASNRFEKGLDPNRTYMAIERSCALLQKYADAKILKDTIIYDKTSKEDKTIEITVDNINNVLGTNITKKEIINIFNKLGFDTKELKDKIKVIVPQRRLDINIKEDLIEEVGRIYGINNIEGKLPKLGIRRGTFDKTTRNIKNKMIDLGLSEVLTQIFINPSDGKKYTTDEFEVVKLLDPLTIEKAALRYTLVPSLMKVYDYNKSHGFKDMTIFEIGKGFYLKDGEYGEDNKLCALLSGDYFYQVGNNIKIDFYVVKGIVEELLDYLGYANRYSFVLPNNIASEFHPGVYASINLQGKEVGYIGKLNPSISKEDIFIFEINLDKLLQNRTSKIKYKEVSKYLGMQKDVAFVFKKGLTNKEVVDVIKKAGGKLLTDIEVFDIYTGDKIGNDEISIAYNLKFEDQNKTLTDEEVMTVFNKIIDSVETKLKAKVRNGE